MEIGFVHFVRTRIFLECCASKNRKSTIIIICILSHNIAKHTMRINYAIVFTSYISQSVSCSQSAYRSWAWARLFWLFRRLHLMSVLTRDTRTKGNCAILHIRNCACTFLSIRNLFIFIWWTSGMGLATPKKDAVTHETTRAQIIVSFTQRMHFFVKWMWNVMNAQQKKCIINSSFAHARRSCLSETHTCSGDKVPSHRILWLFSSLYRYR